MGGANSFAEGVTEAGNGSDTLSQERQQNKKEAIIAET